MGLSNTAAKVFRTHLGIDMAVNFFSGDKELLTLHHKTHECWRGDGGQAGGEI